MTKKDNKLSSFKLAKGKDTKAPKPPADVRKYGKNDGTRFNYKENPYNYHRLFRDFKTIVRAFYEDRNRFVEIYDELKAGTDELLRIAIENQELDDIARITRLRNEIAEGAPKALEPLGKNLIELRKMAELVQKQIDNERYANVETDSTKEEFDMDEVFKKLGND